MRSKVLQNTEEEIISMSNSLEDVCANNGQSENMICFTLGLYILELAFWNRNIDISMYKA